MRQEEVLHLDQFEHGFWVIGPAGERRHVRQDYDVARIVPGGVEFGYLHNDVATWVSRHQIDGACEVKSRSVAYTAHRAREPPGESYRFHRCESCGAEATGSPAQIVHSDACPGLR